MAATHEEAMKFCEFAEHSKVEVGDVSGTPEYVLCEIDAYCIVDKDENRVWMNKEGNMHRLLGPATFIADKKKNAWAIDGDIVRNWDDYERMAGDRVPKEMIMMLKLKYDDSIFDFDED